MRQGASHTSWTSLGVAELRRSTQDALSPLVARPRGVAKAGRAPPVPIGVSVDAVLPVVWAADRAPLGLEALRYEGLRWRTLVGLSEVWDEQFLARVGEGAKTSPRTASGLVAEPLPEKVRVVQKLRCGVAEVTIIAESAYATIVELGTAWLCAVVEHANNAAIASSHWSTAITLSVVEGTATVVMRSGLRWPLAWCGLEFENHAVGLCRGCGR
mmetsp:Transcript_35087/g.76622  ORF Transcript_35087/g.76622 Transcript_35087/m.76622 type:complete len:214 (+) Transcript_35087:1182-1823(+)